MARNSMKAALAACIVVASAGAVALRAEGGPPAAPSFSADGVVHVPAFDLPPSGLMSREGAELMRRRAAMARQMSMPRGDIAVVRQALEKQLAPQVAMMMARYPADVLEQKIAGVPVRIITPKGGAADPARVLINLHGGAFSMCANACSLLESLPVASLGGFKVVSVNYRMAPEAAFPAANEDVTAVYRELLKSYKPKQIGIYGCSAGGALSGQMGAWLPAHGLPQAGALGIFGAGAGRFGTGDSAYVAGYIDGSFPPPSPAGDVLPVGAAGDYFKGADMAGPFVSPMLHGDALAKFPPTLVITGTRAMDMSPAIYTNSQLIKAGVPSTLIVGEGMGHCYMYMAALPEAQDAYRAIVDFFRRNLG